MLTKVWKRKKYYQLLALGAASACVSASAYAADEQFNEALRAANSGNIAMLQQYQSAMQNDALGYYPEYWILNSSLASQPAAQIASFAQRYPQSAMAEKLAAGKASAEELKAAASEISDQFTYGSNMRGSAEYRHHLGRVLLRRCMEEIQKKEEQ